MKKYEGAPVTCTLEGIEKGMYEEGFRWFEALFEDWDIRGKDPAEFRREWGDMSISELKQAVANSHFPLVNTETQVILDGLLESEDTLSGEILEKAWAAWEAGLVFSYKLTMGVINDRLS